MEKTSDLVVPGLWSVYCDFFCCGLLSVFGDRINITLDEVRGGKDRNSGKLCKKLIFFGIPFI